MNNSGQNNTQRWKWKWAFIFAAAGSAVGLGNLWKFPYITEDNNGGAFVLVYLICILLIGLPILIAETIIGKSTNSDLISTFDKLGKPKWKIIGYLSVLVSIIILSYYSVIAGWAVGHFISSLTEVFSSSYQSPDFGAYVTNPMLQIGYHLLFMGITIFIVMKGINRIENSLKWLMSILILFLIALAIYSMFFLGNSSSEISLASQTLAFLFTPDFSEVESLPSMILEALGHSFFTLSVGFGVMIAYGRYLDNGEGSKGVLNSSVWIAMIDTFIAIIACMIMFPIIFVFKERGMEMEAGIGMLFSTIKGILPPGNLIKVIFFLLIAFAALSSTISMLEIVVSALEKKSKYGRKKLTMITGASIALFGIGSALSNGADSGINGIFTNTGIEVQNHKQTKRFIEKKNINTFYTGDFPITEMNSILESEQFRRDYLKHYNIDVAAEDISFEYEEKKDRVVASQKKANLTGVMDLLDYFAVNWLLPIGAFLVAVFVGWFMPEEMKQKEFLHGNDKNLIFYKIWNFLLKYLIPGIIVLILLYSLGVFRGFLS